ncbi:Hypothetical predicted protein [Lecanosticta acicola]|uniref:Uncharacterized protein n=1 Tax=Lecanosticta acicola TaxID=111012 RepID=A0AAI9EDH6_9PEZI|nr:Hypothetical predicted protein [Lecanosticta acicola]
MPSKRRAEWDNHRAYSASSSKRARVTLNNTTRSSVKLVEASVPREIFEPHPDSGIGKDFHGVPYPLTLIPKKTRDTLNRGESDGALFLVAERVSWAFGTVSYAARSLNQVALWAVNTELDIYDPAVDEEDVVIGGRQSRKHGKWYPYQGRDEAKLAMEIVQEAELLTPSSWELWKDMADRAIQSAAKKAEDELVDLTDDDPVIKARRNAPNATTSARTVLQDISPNSNLAQTGAFPAGKAKNMDREPTSLHNQPSKRAEATRRDPNVRCSYQTLPAFYSLLDKIERTSPMGARFLESYAARLHSETCKHCWFERNILKSLLKETPEPEPEPKTISAAPSRNPVLQHRQQNVRGRVHQSAQPSATPYVLIGPPIYQTDPGAPVQPRHNSRAPQSPYISPYPPLSASTGPASQQHAIILPVLPESQAVMDMLTSWARADRNIRDLFEAFARRTATPEQERMFNCYVTAARYRVLPTR